VKSDFQTPGGNIAANLSGFKNLRIIEGDSAKPIEAASLIAQGVDAVRAGEGPVLLRVLVPRLSGHSGQDTQTYKSAEEITAERARDPLVQLRAQLVPRVMSEQAWQVLEQRAHADVQAALAAVEASAQPDPTGTTRFVFSEQHNRAAC
jgi:2-oxoisovalerate dehydrogenase E1 component